MPAAVVAQRPAVPPFAGFSPGACMRGVERVYVGTQWVARDTARLMPGDTVPRILRDSMAVCAQAFGDTVPVWQQLHLARTLLVRERDTEARAVQQRYLRMLDSASVEDRAWARVLVVEDLLDATPSRVLLARTVTEELDQMGDPARRARVEAHVRMAQAARRLWDDAMAVREADAAIVAWQGIGWFQMKLALSVFARLMYEQKAEIALRHQGGEGARAVIDSGLAVMPPQASADRRALAGLRILYAGIGKPAAPIEATFWFNGNGVATPRPVRGRVTILNETSSSCLSCEARYLMLRRLVTQYAGQPFEQVNYTRTRGFYRDTAPAPMPDEARYDSVRFYHVMRATGTLGVYGTRFRFIPDGRRKNESTPKDDYYPLASFVVVDKQGIIRYVQPPSYQRAWLTGWDAELEGLVAQFIARLMAEPGPEEQIGRSP